MIYQNFLLFCELCFYFLGRVLWCTNLFNFVDIYFICFCCCCLCFVSYLWNCCLIRGQKDVHPCFLQNSVVLPTFRSSIHFWVSFCSWCEVGVQLHAFACGYPVAPRTICWKGCCFPLNGLAKFLFKISYYRHMDPQFFSVQLYVYSYVSTTLSWLP